MSHHEHLTGIPSYIRIKIISNPIKIYDGR